MQNENVSIVRILDITIENFKNVGFGYVAFASSKIAKKQGLAKGRDVLGIYGQNGSGKTALVEALIVWRQVIREQAMEEELKELIREDTVITINFFVQNGDEKYLLCHTLGMCNQEHNIAVAQQASYRTWDKERWSRKRMLRPTRKNPDKDLLHMLKVYAEQGLWIATTRQQGLCNLNIGVTIDFTYQEKGNLREEQRVALFEKNQLSGQQLVLLQRMIEQLNVVLQAVLPDIQLGLVIKQLDSSGEETENYEVTLTSKRYGREFPLYNESGGIKRLLSILTLLIAAYNCPSVCIVVDEIDAGVFEYLLGEVLDIMRTGAKGQLLFTSHNLRALEVLGKDHIIFSTVNPKNRYIRFTCLQKNRNLRDEYLRTVLIGGQLEAIYEERKSLELGYAFRKAGKINGKSQISDTCVGGRFLR